MLRCILLTVCGLSAALAGDREFTPNETTGVLEYQDVFDVSGKSKAQLFGLAKEWIAESFRDSEAVTQLADPARGRLLARGNFEQSIMGGLGHHRVLFDATIEVRDGKARLTFTDVVSRYEGLPDAPLEGHRMFRKTGDKAARKRAQFTETFHRIADSLGKALEKDYVSDDW